MSVKVLKTVPFMATMMLCVAAAMPSFGAKPYDAEVEYLDANATSGATSYFDTGVLPADDVGALVAEGTAYSPQGSKYHEDGNFWGPAGTTITISNATFDVRGNTDYYNKTFVLDGGTLASSASDMNATSCGFGDITLLSNSTFDLRGHTCFTIPDGAGSTRIDLGGNTLTVALGLGKHMYLNKEVANGTLDFTSGGYLHTIAGALSGSPTVNVEMHGAALNLEADMCVSNYVARYTSAYNHGSGAFKVYGTFTPDAVLANGNECFHGCEMQNGSSIDLSAKTNAWSGVALGWTGTGNMDGNRTTTFANGATVGILLGTRKVKSEEKIIDWSDAMPENRAGLTFFGQFANGRRTNLKVMDDGLYALRKGFILIVK